MEDSRENLITGSSVRVDSLDLKNLFNLTSQLLVLKNHLLETPEISKIPEPKLRQALIELDKLTKKIEDNALSLKLIPIKGLVIKTHRMVVEISKKFNKQVELHFEGEDTKIDREMMDFLSDIFTHLIRNSMDHGIESPLERKTMGKKEIATISIKIMKKGREVIIEFGDDGKGIDKKKVIQKAIEKKVLEPGTDFDLIPDEQIYSLLFEGGFSTATVVTDISGRGIGMGFIKSTVEKLRGKIEVSSTLNQGSIFKLTLPIDTSIIDVLVAEINKIPYLITLNDVKKVILSKDLHSYQVPYSKKFLILENKPVPIIEPGTFFPEGGNKTLGKEVFLAFSSQGRSFALLLDDLIMQTQIVFNPLPMNLINKENFISGSAILSSGKVSHLLDLTSLADYHLERK